MTSERNSMFAQVARGVSVVGIPALIGFGWSLSVEMAQQRERVAGYIALQELRLSEIERHHADVEQRTELLERQMREQIYHMRAEHGGLSDGHP